jgi:hypothetical protein
VACSIATKSGRAMTGALTGGERRGPVLAQLAKGRMRAKIPACRWRWRAGSAITTP